MVVNGAGWGNIWAGPKLLGCGKQGPSKIWKSPTGEGPNFSMGWVGFGL